MSTVTRPRGPLPPRVYWTRRVVVLLLALLLVFGISRLLGGGGGGTDPTARPVGAAASTSTAPASAATTPASPATTPADPSPTATATGAATATATPTTDGSKKSASASATPLAQPTGPCSAGDIVATPTVKGNAYAGRPVVFRLALTTKQSPACTWTVSPRAVVVKVIEGPDRVWSTQQCRGAVPRQAVVVRKDHPAAVAVAWNGQRSDAACSRSTTWAEPGLYHVIAAAYGSDPVDEQFQLLSPPAATVTKTPKPRPKGAGHAGAARSSGGHGQASSTASPTASPSSH